MRAKCSETSGQLFENYSRVPEGSLVQDPRPQDVQPTSPQWSIYSTEHSLLMKVYTDLGLIRPEDRDSIEEQVSRNALFHRTQYEGKVRPLLAAPLTTQVGLRALVDNFDKGQTASTTVLGELWDNYALASLNRRSIDGQNDPRPWSVIGIRLAAVNIHKETGLTMTTMTSREQRYALGTGMVANITDWLALAAIYRELGYRPPDHDLTVTRFPQLEALSVGRRHLWVGDASMHGSRTAALHGSDKSCNTIGVRRLVQAES